MSQYSLLVLTHYRNPRNFGKLEKPTATATELNPLCGDEVKVYLKIAKGQIEDIKYEAHGCALSIAAASLLSQEIKDSRLKIQDIGKWDLPDMKQLLGIEVGRAREGCATLALNAIKKSMDLSS